MQESKEQRVHGVFEKIYKNYDQMNSVISFQQHKKWRDKTMQIIRSQASQGNGRIIGLQHHRQQYAQGIGEYGRRTGGNAYGSEQKGV